MPLKSSQLVDDDQKNDSKSNTLSMIESEETTKQSREDVLPTDGETVTSVKEENHYSEISTTNVPVKGVTATKSIAPSPCVQGGIAYTEPKESTTNSPHTCGLWNGCEDLSAEKALYSQPVCLIPH